MIRSEANAYAFEEAGIQGTLLHKVHNRDHVFYNLSARNWQMCVGRQSSLRGEGNVLHKINIIYTTFIKKYHYGDKAQSCSHGSLYRLGQFEFEIFFIT